MRAWPTFALGCSLFIAGCGDDDPGPTEPTTPAEPTWGIVHQGLSGALLSVWAPSADDVWAVGGDGGGGPMVLHFDGTSWTQHTTGTQGDLWWVHGFVGGPVFMSGEGGVILKYEGGAFEVMTTPGDATVFGIWGPSADDLWAVGGAGSTPTDGFVWRYDGATWSEDPSAAALDLTTSATVFKVWGRSANDVYMVGTEGLILHDDGSGLAALPSPITRPLLTVHGNADFAVAVGGFASGSILEASNGDFEDVTPPSCPQMSGVHVTDDGEALAAGLFGSIMAQTDTGFELVDHGLSINDDFHSIFVDDEGGYWAVGGLLIDPPINGMMVYRGTRELAGATLSPAP
jgi:hypothetical protein